MLCLPPESHESTARPPPFNRLWISLQAAASSDESFSALSQALPGGGEPFLDSRAARPLPLGQPAGRKRSSCSHVLDGGRAQALLGDDRILVLAQQLLQGPGIGEEPLSDAALRRGQLGRVAGPLERDPEPVD